jgi:hypothetical protein
MFRRKFNIKLMWMILVIIFSMKESRENLFSFEYLDYVNY